MSDHDDATDHLAAARNYLAIADDGFALKFEDPRTSASEADAAGAKTRLALQLAEQHRAVAEAIWLSMPGKIEVAPDPEQQTRARIAKDVAAHDAVQVRPSTDPEPDGGEGDLWTTGDGWYLYAVDAAVTPHSPGQGYQFARRWLLIRHYAQFLRWRDANGPQPWPMTWPDLAGLHGGDDVVLRRPTAEERATFYGPEPDPAPEDTQAHRVEAFVADQANRLRTDDNGFMTTARFPLGAFTSREGTALDELGHDDMRALMDELARRLPSEQGQPEQAAGRPWRSPGGAGQWREG